MKNKFLTFFGFISFLGCLLFFSNCSIKPIGEKKTGCKGIYFQNQKETYSDSTINKLKKGIGLMDAIVSKTILNISNSTIDSTDMYERYKKKVIEVENNTPEAVVSSYNARINDFCYRTKELLKLSKDKKNYSEIQRQRFLDEYFIILGHYRTFLDILDGRNNSSVDDILKKK